MSDELLYNAVKSGRVNIADLNDDGRKALFNYLDQKTGFTQKNDDAQMQEFYHQQPFEYTKDPDQQVIDQWNSLDNPDLQSRGDLRTDYPGGLLNPVNDINRFRKTAVGQGIDRFAQAAGHAIGLSDDQMSSKASTGNPLIDKGLDFAGGTAGYMVNPAMPTGNLGVVSNFFEHPAINQAAAAVGNRAQALLPDAGLTVSRDGSQIVDSLLGNTVNKAAQGAVQGGLGAAAFSPFHTLETGGDLSDIPQNMLEEGLGGAALGGLLEGASPAVGKAIQQLLGRRGISEPQLDPSVYDQAAGARNVQAAGGGVDTSAMDEMARRADFIHQNTFGNGTLALPPSAQEVRLNEIQQNRPQPQPGTEPIPQPGDVRTFALPEPDVAPPTTARAAANPWRQKFDNLINIANQLDHPPGRELESLEDLWSRMAGPNDPSLSELVDLAYPPSKVTPDALRRAKEQQYARDVAGVSGPVKSMADRYDGGVKGEAAGPTEVLKSMRQPDQPAVEVTPPKRKFATSDASVAPDNVKAAAKGKAPKPEPMHADPGNVRPLQTNPPRDDVQAYSGNQIPFRQASGTTDKTISRNQIIKNMKKNLGVTIDTGRLPNGMTGALGIYKVGPEVVRSRMAEDVQVIAHEIGHHLDKKFDLQDPRYQQELTNLLHQNGTINISAYQPHQLHGEGIAEYVRLRLTDPAEAQRLAPNFTKYFNESVPKKVLRGLEKTRGDIDTWINQGPYHQAMGLLDFESGGEKDKFSFQKTYTRMIDDLNPIKIFEKALTGKVNVGADSIYKMARLSRGIAERAKLAVDRGIYLNGQKISNGLAEIVKPLEKLGVSEKEFATYLAVKHAEDLQKLNKQVPFDADQMHAILQKLDTPEMQAIQQKVVKYSNALMDVLADAQIISPKALQEMRQKYPNYVPFMRYFDDDAVAGYKNGGYGAAKGFANITNPTKRMSEEGSLRTIINPFESIVKNTFLVMNAAAKNKVGLHLADLSKIDGAGAWVEHVGEGGRDPLDHVVSVYENGVKQAYKIREPELYNAMLSLDTESSNSLLRFMGGFASILRAGATLTPEFMARNAFRDVMDAMVNSTQYGFNPIDFFKGLYHVIGKTHTFDQFISSGGAMGTMMSLDREANREALKAIFKESMRDKALNVVTDPKELVKMLTGVTPIQKAVKVLRHGAEISELSTRVGAFNKALKKSGSVEEAAFTAKDLMDFNRAGSAIRPANRAIAFLNAGLQGTDRLARSFWGDGPLDFKSKGKFLIRAFTTLVLPTIGLHYWINNLDPEKKKLYNNIPQWQKDSFFIIPGPGNSFIRIPKPFEAGILFSTGTERALRWLKDNDPQAYKDYGSSLLQTLTPPTMISALSPLLEAITNYSFFKNAPIVPQGEQRLEKKDQYGMYTSELAKLLGQGVSQLPAVAGMDPKNSMFASPRIIDNTIKGYTAGLGQYAVNGVDALLKALSGNKGVPQPAQQWYEQPPVSGFLATTNGGGQVRQDFYDRWNELNQEKASAAKNQQPFQEQDYGRMKLADSAISQLMKQYKLIQNSQNYSPEAKRSLLDDLDAKMNQIAAMGLGKK